MNAMTALAVAPSVSEREVFNDQSESSNELNTAGPFEFESLISIDGLTKIICLPDENGFLAEVVWSFTDELGASKSFSLKSTEDSEPLVYRLHSLMMHLDDNPGLSPVERANDALDSIDPDGALISTDDSAWISSSVRHKHDIEINRQVDSAPLMIIHVGESHDRRPNEMHVPTQGESITALFGTTEEFRQDPQQKTRIEEILGVPIESIFRQYHHPLKAPQNIANGFVFDLRDFEIESDGDIREATLRFALLNHIFCCFTEGKSMYPVQWAADVQDGRVSTISFSGRIPLAFECLERVIDRYREALESCYDIINELSLSIGIRRRIDFHRYEHKIAPIKAVIETLHLEIVKLPGLISRLNDFADEQASAHGSIDVVERSAFLLDRVHHLDLRLQQIEGLRDLFNEKLQERVFISTEGATEPFKHVLSTTFKFAFGPAVATAARHFFPSIPHESSLLPLEVAAGFATIVFFDWLRNWRVRGK